MVVATELHFSRAAQKLTIGQPTLSDLIRRLERELGTPLFIRTTRRVVLTEAGAELLQRATTILADVGAAAQAVSRIARGEEGTVRLGVTPPVVPVLAPTLVDGFTDAHPGISVEISQLWLPALVTAVTEGTVDVAITCGLLDRSAGMANEVICAQPLLVGLRPGHRLANQETVLLSDLARDRLGATSASLFPAWALAQRQALTTVGINPPEVPLAMTELAANRWQAQPEIDWIMLLESLAPDHPDTVIRPVTPALNVPFTLQWNAEHPHSPAVVRFVQHARTAALPPGWVTATGSGGRRGL